MSDEPKKPSRAELTARKARMVRAMVDQRANHADIKKAFSIQFDCSTRSAERFITKAYAQIREEKNRNLEQHRDDAYAFYSAMVADVTLPARDRMRAHENLDKITGVAQPIKVAATDTEGNDATRRPKSPDEIERELDRLLGGDAAAIPPT